jgi:hypothetical protein
MVAWSKSNFSRLEATSKIPPQVLNALLRKSHFGLHFFSCHFNFFRSGITGSAHAKDCGA